MSKDLVPYAPQYVYLYHWHKKACGFRKTDHPWVDMVTTEFMPDGGISRTKFKRTLHRMRIWDEIHTQEWIGKSPETGRPIYRNIVNRRVQ